MYIELAEGTPTKRRVRRSGPAASKYHIYVPGELSESGQSLYVREDYFDDLADNDWEYLMDALEPYEFGLSGKGKQRRAERRQRRTDRKEARKTRKADRHAARMDKKSAKAEFKRARGRAKETKAQAKLIKAQNGGGESFNSIVDKAGDFVSRFRGGGGDAEGPAPGPDAAARTYATVPDPGTETPPPNNVPYESDGDDEIEILGMKMNKTVAYVGGAALLAGGIYWFTRKR